MRTWRYCLAALAALLALGVSTSTTPAGELLAADAHPNPPFTLASVDACFLAAPAPFGSVWPLAPIGRSHPIRGSLNEPRGASPHFGVDVEALINRAPVYAISPGVVSGLKRKASHFSIKVVGQSHFFQYWHVIPLTTMHLYMAIEAGQLIGHVQNAYYHVHVSEFSRPCGWINPMRPGGALHVGANTEKPHIGNLRAFAADSKAFRPFNSTKGPACEVDPSTPLELTDLHGVVDLRAAVWDWPVKQMVTRAQMSLEPAAIQAYLAPRFNPYEHVSKIKRVYDGASLLVPAHLGTTIWHIWAFGTWRDCECYYQGRARGHCGADYVWHVGGTLGLHTALYRNGPYQYCVDALTINGRAKARCTPVIIKN
jgi:hypothetical protein